MVITYLSCPVCETGKKTGLPNGSTVEAVTEESRVVPEAPREKVRWNRCPNGHGFYFHFSW